MEYFVSNQHNFKFNTKGDREPVKISQDWSNTARSMRTNEKDKENNIFLVGFTLSPFLLFADILVADKPAFCS